MITKWEVIGTYLGRIVRTSIHDLKYNTGMEYDGNMSESLVLIYLDMEYELSEVNTLIHIIIKKEPLAIVIAGKNTDKVFDHLLEYLSDYQSNKHIMTKLCSDDDFTEIGFDFLSATWPTDELFEEWKAYSVLFVGSDESKYVELLTKLKNLLD